MNCDSERACGNDHSGIERRKFNVLALAGQVVHRSQVQSVQSTDVRWEWLESPPENMRRKFDKLDATKQMAGVVLALFIHSASMQSIPYFELQ